MHALHTIFSLDFPMLASILEEEMLRDALELIATVVALGFLQEMK